MTPVFFGRRTLPLAAALLCSLSSNIKPAYGQVELTVTPATESLTATPATVATVPPVLAGTNPWINEFHYDNLAVDVNEFIEVAVPDALANEEDLQSYQIILYNGFYGRVYLDDAYHPLTTFTKGSSSNGVTFYSKLFAPANCTNESTWCGLQNGKDGFALANFVTPTSGRVLEFLSYEGTFRAKDGPANNMTTTDVGVQQFSKTPKGWSLAKEGIGCDRREFFWQISSMATQGNVNTDQTISCEVTFVNEFHYDNINNGEGQFVEVATNADDISGYSMVLYNGQDGMPYDAIPLTTFTEGETTDDGLTFYYYEFPSTGMGMILTRQFVEVIDANGTATPSKDPTTAGIAIANADDVVVDFIGYGGSFTAQGGVAESMTSVDVGVVETLETPVGSSLQLQGVGCDSTDFEWVVVQSNQLDFNQVGDTRGTANVGQEIDCVRDPVAPVKGDLTFIDNTSEVDDDDDFLDPETMKDISTAQLKKAFSQDFEKGKYPVN